jgi:hypothetical protein
VRGAGDVQHALAQALWAANGTAFHQVGDDRKVGAGLDGTFVHRANALADFQADVPQQRQKTLDGITKNFMIGAVEQNQQIDIGKGVQLTTTVATDRDQGDVGVFAPVELLPGLLQDVIDEPGAILDQPADLAAVAKAPVLKAAIGLAFRASSAWNWPRSKSSGSTCGIDWLSCL